MKPLTLGTEVIEFTEDKFTRLIDRNATAMGYIDFIPNPNRFAADPDTSQNPHTMPNPELKLQFVHRKLKEILIENVRQVEANENIEKIRKAAYAKVAIDFE